MKNNTFTAEQFRQAIKDINEISHLLSAGLLVLMRFSKNEVFISEPEWKKIKTYTKEHAFAITSIQNALLSDKESKRKNIEIESFTIKQKIGEITIKLKNL